MNSPKQSRRCTNHAFERNICKYEAKTHPPAAVGPSCHHGPALCLENEYVKLAVLPEIGGRIFSATDKTNGYEFIHRQSVIKPANIGMIGAWISGGSEGCFPHHHRASTFMTVDHRVIENADGSTTVREHDHSLHPRWKPVAWAVVKTVGWLII